MTFQRLFSLVLALGIFALPTFGCGGDEAEEGSDTEITVESDSEAENGEGAAASMASLQKELYEVIAGIETVEDAEAADPQVEEIFTQMADLIRRYADDPSAAAAAQNDPSTREYEQKMQEHIQKISTEDPMVGMAIGKLMLKHSDKVIKAATEALDGEGMSKALDEAGAALDDAEKALDNLRGE